VLQIVLSSAQTITTRIGAPEALVELSCVGRIGPDKLVLRLLAVDSSAEELLEQRLGLTTREAEVPLWLGRGKSNRDIAEVLGLSPRTVNKHLPLTYAKTGVKNRATATGNAVRTAGQS